MSANSNEESYRKLNALYRSFEVAEREASKEFKSVEEVYIGRQKNLLDLEEEKLEKLETLSDFRKSKRPKALIEGNMTLVSSILKKEKLLEKQLSELNVEIEKSSKEVEMAKERADIYEQELIDVRIEKKKVERLLENRENLARSLSVASLEALTDELNYFRRKKDK